MAVSYMKKKKMYAYAQELGYQMPRLCECTYRFYRGWEWLSFTTPDYFSVKLSVAYNGRYIHVREWECDDDCNEIVRRDETLVGIV